MWSYSDGDNDCPYYKLKCALTGYLNLPKNQQYKQTDLEDVMGYITANNRNYISMQTDSGEYPIILNSVRECSYSVLNIPNIKRFILQSTQCTKVFGVCTIGGVWMQINLGESNKYSFIIGNLNNQEMRVFEEDEEGVLQELQFNLDGEAVSRSNDKNEIWNGHTVNGQPFGFGFYSQGEHRIFEGFEYNGNHVCFGKLFSSENGHCEYEGGFCNGTQCGPASIQYDANGAVQYEGDWLDQSPFTNEGKEYYTSSSSIIQVYRYDDDSNNNDFFISPWLSQLHSVTIGGPFNYTISCKIEHLQNLSFFTCLRNAFNENDCVEKDEERIVRIRDCPELGIIEFGKRAFSMHKRLEISDLPNLTILHIGKYNFSEIKEFVIKDLPHLSSISIGYESVRKCEKAVFENLPSLEEIKFATRCLWGNSSSFKRYETDVDDFLLYESCLTLRSIILYD